MKRIFITFLAFLLFFFSVQQARATYDPASRSNNKIGIHILFPQELENAAKLVNSSGGDWGYVTVPIQYEDRDLAKWQSFMNDASRLHLIPIIRLATEPYHSNTNVWRKPNYADILDFSNFLGSLNWPTKNRYVILFNEVNRSDEWGGDPPSAQEYTDLVKYAEEVFKANSSDFFLITAGLDNAAPNDGVHYMDNFVFLRDMGNYDPEVFKNIDGLSSHSYPNPGFIQAPKNTQESTSTYKFENSLVENYAGGLKPIFITETGWDATKLPGSVISSYLKDAGLTSKTS